MRNGLIGIALVVAALGQMGCLELVRRSGGPASAVWTERATSVTASTEIPERQTGTAAPDTAYTQDDAGTPASATQLRPAVVSDKIRARRRQVNAYALWCLEQGMWNEARSHMEQALQQDSLSASLHNNLAIVYEHFGDSGQAAVFYRKAIALSLRDEHYELNLGRLERHRNAAIDTTETIDLFELKKRTPGPRQAPY